MSGAGISREDLRLLLPFLANGSLAGDDRAALERALADDPALSAELETLKRLREAVRDTGEDFSPGAFGLARLNRALDAQSAPARSPANAPSRIAPVAAAAAILAIVAVTGIVVLQDRELDYIQASGEFGAPAYGETLTVAFRPSAAQSDVSALLSDLGLTIVDGPSAIGLYRVAIPLDQSAEAVAEALSAATGIVESVDLP